MAMAMTMMAIVIILVMVIIALEAHRKVGVTVISDPRPGKRHGI